MERIIWLASSKNRLICTITYIYYMIYSHTCHACVTRGPHASCHVAAAPRRNGAVDPRATWARSPRQPRLGPLATSAAGNFSPFFAILTKKFLKKINKKSNKNRKNSIKLQKLIFLKIQLLFNPNFLHWITNSFLFNIMSFKICFQEGNKDELKFH